MLSKAFLTTLLPCLIHVNASPTGHLDRRESLGTAVVSLTNNTGDINHLASGIIFGVPDNPSQIPDHMYTDWGFNFLRGGGAQLPSPRAGWTAGVTEYENRMQQVLDNYHTAQKYGAKFIFIFENIYGNWDVVNGPYPGDNGDWSDWDVMTDRVIEDLKADGVNFDDFIIDIINESDGGWYWQRPPSQAFEMWRRTYAAFRKAFGSDVKIQGPSSSGYPNLNNDWWTAFAQFVSENDCVPDTWTWHMEFGGGNMMESTAGLHAVLDKYNLPYNDVNINEYAVASEQVPSGAGWWISQLERVNTPGLRGNWQSYPALYDYLANLVSKPKAPNASPTAGGYFPNGEYQVYKYYAQSMTGHRIGTMPSPDMVVDVYATLDPDARTVKILSGNRQRMGTWTIQVQGLTSLGLPASGDMTIHCLAFPNDGWWGEIDGPNDCGMIPYSYTDDKLDIELIQRDTASTYAFEISY
ncbi:glycoside hydrolase family 39 [Fusarium denticulatum]|uniref:Glycoside hydrolase family 39 n=1 Tax=Fusarium denticulatum TaxID=48507 RepID=A0A8H5WGL9_9HYPO|nr:glycoside hydrolase family 39 [Fusarium denticulatum]